MRVTPFSSNQPMGKEHPMRQGPVVRPRHSQKLDDPKNPTGHSNYGLYNPHENWILYGDGSKPWYLVNPKIAGKWMFIPLKMYL